MRVQDNLGVVAFMYTPSPSTVIGVAPTPLRDVVESANFIVQYPNGSLQVFPMHDDGLHSDGRANVGCEFPFS